jgi:tRNA threonylcarbamoyladenosine biosynthesis protein TsaE
LTITVNNEEELKIAAKQLLDFAGEHKTFLVYGEMGAGKTTFIKHVCLLLGSEDNFSSPTYSIVNEYNYPDGKIFHFDLYRLKNATELLDIGIDDYLYSNNYCFFEWPNLVEVFLDDKFISVTIKVEDNIRYIRAAKNAL